MLGLLDFIFTKQALCNYAKCSGEIKKTAANNKKGHIHIFRFNSGIRPQNSLRILLSNFQKREKKMHKQNSNIDVLRERNKPLSVPI